MPALVSYKVGVSRSKRGGAARHLTLQLAAPEGKIHAVSLFFCEGKPPTKLGHINEHTGMVNVYMPAEDFDPIYKVLNTEKPVYVHWRCDPEEQQVVSIDISTDEEPLGEGTPDKSP